MQRDNLLHVLSELEATLEVVQRNRYNLTGRTRYAKKTRDQIARVKRELEAICRSLMLNGNENEARKLTENLSGLLDPRASVDHKLQALDSIRFIWQSDISPLLAETAQRNDRKDGLGESFLPPDTFTNCTKPLQAIAAEVNRSFAQECPNGASMLLRRLAEMLIVDAYELAGESEHIRNQKGYVGLSELIDQATSGRVFRLSSPAKQGLKDLKSFGDGAAHSRFFVVNNEDLEKVRAPLRVCFDELAGRCDELRLQRRGAKVS